MRKKRAIVAVTNDLFTDQRVDKVCRYLTQKGIEVVLVGRKLVSSRELVPRIYETHRLNLTFTKGALFYAEYNIRLFFFLLFSKFDFLVSNDLDTLPACNFAAAAKGKKLVYDSHEYFTEVPELQNRKLIKTVWEIFEIMIFKNLTRAYTVNDSIAGIYNRKYKMQFRVVKNVPENIPVEKNKTRKDLNLPEDKNILIMQGAGINIQRGAEELSDAMRMLDNCFLVIVGSGDVFPLLKEKISIDPDLRKNILLVDKLPYQEMMQYTLNADIGFSLDKNTNPNYLYSLPNKLFDYMRAGIPVIATDLVEIGKVIREYQCGTVIQEVNENSLCSAIKQMLSDKEKMNMLGQNGKRAIQSLNWENQTKELDKIYQGLF